jgi:iron-sulfur cluster repair protein YtfE (RIC family)
VDSIPKRLGERIRKANEELARSREELRQRNAQMEDDLHQHIHLENNILFPRSIELVKTFSTAT